MARLLALACSVLAVVALTSALVRDYNDVRFLECSPGDSPVHVAFATLSEEKLVIGEAVDVDVKGTLTDNLADHALKITAKRYKNGQWLEDVLGPYPVAALVGLNGGQAGAFHYQASVVLPAKWDSALYTISATIHNPTDEVVWCMSLNEQLYPKTAAGKFDAMPKKSERRSYGQKKDETEQASNGEDPLGKIPQTAEEWAEFRKHAMESMPAMMEEHKKRRQEHDVVERERIRAINRARKEHKAAAASAARISEEL